MFRMTVKEALTIQDRQIAYYAPLCPTINLKEKVKADTTAHELDPDVDHDVVVINRHIPRGGFIEAIIQREMEAIHGSAAQTGN